MFALAGFLALGLLPAGCADLLGDVVVTDQDIRVDVRPIRGSPDAGSCEGDDEPACAALPCTPASRRCRGKLLQSCNSAGDGWTLVDQCASAALCDSAAGACRPTACAREEYRCSETGELQSCNREQTGFEFREQCLSGAYCSALSGREGCEGDPCTARRLRCNAARVERCLDDRSGFIAEGPPCASAALCQEENGSARCIDPLCEAGQFRCSSAELQRCADGRDRFVPVQQCLRADLCRATLGRCEEPCLAGTQRCTGSTLERCSAANVFVPVADCGNAAQCDATEPACLAAPPPPPPPPPVLGTDPYTFVSASSPAAAGVGSLRVSVPAEWTQVDTTPWSSSAGLPLGPRFIASTDTARFRTVYDIPGVYFAATAQTPLTVAARLAEFDLSATCTRAESAPYSDPAYTGTRQTYVNCGSTGATTVVLAATPADGSVVCIVIVTTLAERDQTARDRVWESFEVVQ
jgi:hypothetical protein